MSTMDTTAHTTTVTELPFWVRFFQFFESLGVLAILLIVVVVTSIIAPVFFTPTNLNNLLITASIMAVTGFGMTMAIAMRGFDLSVGSTQALAAIMAASLLSSVSIPVAIVGALFTGLVIGVINGVVISKLRVPAFVATLGMMGIVRGVALLYTEGQSIMIMGENSSAYAALNNGKLLGIPVPLIIALIALAVMYVLLQRTPFGRHVCAIGGNETAAVASGINIDLTTILVFGLVGVTAALSGVMLSSKLLIVDGTLGVGFELQAIAISVLGGTSLMGGNGNLLGTFFAALLLAVISSALNIMKVESYYQYLALGLLLIIALSLDTVRRAILAQMLKRSY